MEETNYKLFDEILKRLDDRKLLDHLVVVGSWCNYIYRDYFKSDTYQSTIRTRDIDLLIILPIRMPEQVNFMDIIDDLGFVESLVGDEGYTRYVHPELIIEFLIEEKGKGFSKPVYIENLGVTPQPLRFLGLLESGKIKINFKGLSVYVPHPANFALHKLLISSRRKEGYKAEMDRRQGIKLLRDLINHGELSTLKSVISSIPKTWQKTIKRELKALGEGEILQRIEEVL